MRLLEYLSPNFHWFLVQGGSQKLILWYSGLPLEQAELTQLLQGALGLRVASASWKLGLQGHVKHQGDIEGAPTVFSVSTFIFLFFIFKRFYLFIFREGKGGRKRGEKQQCVVAFHIPPTGDPACSPGIYPDCESNWQPFGLQAGAQSTEPHQPGLYF